MSSPTWLVRWWHQLRPDAPSRLAESSLELAPEGTWALGARQAPSEVSAKATNLDRARAAGLEVPAGFIVPDGVTVRSEQVANWSDAADVSLAVRSAFAAEDRGDQSLAGWFDSELRVAPGDVAASVERVRASAVVRDGAFRTDVLVMVMVDAQHSGVAFSEPGTFDDLVNVTAGTAEALVGGQEAGERLMLPRAEAVQEGWQRRLQRLLRKVRDEFGDEPWDAEWADDGTACWLVQLRPITAPIRRNELLTIANHAEILPALPSRLMATVVEESGPELFDWYRNFDPTLPANRDFLHVVAGRPFINLSLLEDMLRHWGLPTAMVADAIGGDSGSHWPARPGQILRKAPSLLRLGLFQIWAVLNSDAREQRAARFGSVPTGTFDDAIRQARGAYVALVTGMFPLSSAIGPPLTALRTLGVLNEHAATHRTITTEMMDALNLARRDPSTMAHFLERFGHRGVYESDFSRPRYRDHPALIVGEAKPAGAGTGPGVSGPAASAQRDAAPPARSLKGWLTLPVWWVTSVPMAARERLRHESMRSFADLHDAFHRLGAAAVERGQLPSVGDVWNLTTAELRRLDDGWTPDATFWSERRAEIEHLTELDPPPLIRLHDDPADWAHDTTSTGGATSTDGILTGIGLTDGTVRGRAWVLREPSVDRPEFPVGKTANEPVVLIARSIDAGWMPTMLMVDAVVAEIGGDLSHGSILLREHGMPAVTNVRGVTRSVSSGDLVEVRAGAGRLVVLESRRDLAHDAIA